MPTFGNMGKFTEIAGVSPQNLSGGQVAAVIICIAAVVTAGFAWYTYGKVRTRGISMATTIRTGRDMDTPILSRDCIRILALGVMRERKEPASL